MIANVLAVSFKTEAPLNFEAGVRYFYTVNFPSIAIPAVAIDVYSDFLFTLSTALLTHGLGPLFLLWYITPRTILDRNDRANVLAG